jgi:hypothetical protein
MPNKDRPLVDRHALKNGVGWLMNDQEGKVCSFTKDMPTAHAHLAPVETKPVLP